MNKYSFQFVFDQKTGKLIQQFQKNTSNQLWGSSQNKLRKIAFFTSHMNQCTIFCDGKSQLLMQQNKKYEIEINFQAFSMQNSQDRIIIHMIDTQTGLIIKKCLLKIAKIFQGYRKIYQLKLMRKKPIVFKYNLKNPYSKQCAFKFYCSNHSILQIPETQLILGQRQQTSIQLQIQILKQNISNEQISEGIFVIMRIEDSIQKNGWNQLFKIFVQ